MAALAFMLFGAIVGGVAYLLYRHLRDYPPA
jgi:hypothetical protein